MTAQLDVFLAPDWTRARLLAAHRTVLELLADHGWHDVKEVAALLRCNEAAAGARVRDLRKPRYGQYPVECQRFGRYTTRTESGVTTALRI